jgi:hypothetical protein
VISIVDLAVLCSAAGYLLLQLVWQRDAKNWRLFAFEATGILLLLVFLHLALGMFDFSIREKGQDEDLPRLGWLYASMTLGMLSQYLYFWLLAGEMAPFNLRELLATFLIAPVVFIPFYNTIKGSWSDGSIHWLVCLVAYENGFFFKNTFDQRRRLPKRPGRRPMH